MPSPTDAACHDCCERWTGTGGREHDRACPHASNEPRPSGVARLLADHLEPWWRCVHEQPPMGASMEVGRCDLCETERAEVGRALADALLPPRLMPLDSLADPRRQAGIGPDVEVPIVRSEGRLDG